MLHIKTSWKFKLFPCSWVFLYTNKINFKLLCLSGFISGKLDYVDGYAVKFCIFSLPINEGFDMFLMKCVFVISLFKSSKKL